MTKDDFAEHLQALQDDETALREAGQKEYARDDDNAFSNFERVSQWIKIQCPCGCEHVFSPSREVVLMVYLLKHIDGILSDIAGHTSQRESVQGRILDARVYLGLLSGMRYAK